MLFTSGATGRPRACVYRHRQVRAQLELLRTTYGITADDRSSPRSRRSRSTGRRSGVASAVPDMDVTAPGTLTAAALADAAAAVDATVVFASPAALRNVVATAADLTAEHRAALGRVRLLMSAGAPVPAALLRAVRELLPDADAAHPVRHDRGAAGDRHLAAARSRPPGPGDGVCVGRPLPGVERARSARSTADGVGRRPT